jgi:hypothetical protein
LQAFGANRQSFFGVFQVFNAMLGMKVVFFSPREGLVHFEA